MHHSFMRLYGWIPLMEFKNIPMVTCLNLLSCAEKENKEQEKSMKKK